MDSNPFSNPSILSALQDTLKLYSNRVGTAIHKSHNVTVWIYHLVFPAKYRRAVFDEEVDDILESVCMDIQKRYQIKFLEIGTDKDHVHFLVQSVPTYSVTKIITMIKSLTAREIFRRCPQVRRQLWGGEFWTAGISRVRLESMEMKI